VPLELALLPERLSICRFAADTPVPAWALGPLPFVSITRTADELSIIAPTEQVPESEKPDRREDGWRALELAGPFALAEVGVLLQVATPLAEARVSILPVATFDTDYVLVPERLLARAIDALREAGHVVAWGGG
jgi:hypothetical protein